MNLIRFTESYHFREDYAALGQTPSLHWAEGMLLHGYKTVTSNTVMDWLWIFLVLLSTFFKVASPISVNRHELKRWGRFPVRHITHIQYNFIICIRQWRRNQTAVIFLTVSFAIRARFRNNRHWCNESGQPWAAYRLTYIYLSDARPTSFIIISRSRPCILWN